MGGAIFIAMIRPPLHAVLAVLLAAPPVALAGQAQPSQATIGLALSGGSAKGIAHVGVIRALERIGVRIDVVAGTSMGSVVGGLYSMGLPIDSVESVIRAADWGGLRGDEVGREHRFLAQRRLDERAVLSVPIEALRATLPRGAIVGSNVTRLLESVTWQAAAVRSFDELPRPFVAVATDLETGEAVPLRGGVLAEAMRASIAIPTVLEPFTINDRLLVDGAVSRNLPAEDARALGADVVICSDVSDPLDSADELSSLVDIFSQITSLAMLASTVEQRELCDVVIRPDVEDISPYAFDDVSDWVLRGDTAVAPHVERLLAVAGRRGGPDGIRVGRPLLSDSVRLAAVVVQGTDDPRVTGLVRDELALVPGDYVTREGMRESLEDLEATGLFHLVRYRLDPSAEGVGANLVLTIDEGARNRIGLGVRYDDEYRAALLFTATIHNRILHGSVTRFDLRVGEETRIAAAVSRRRGITGRFGVGIDGSWSQSELRLPATLGVRRNVEILNAGISFGLAATRGTGVSLEIDVERADLDEVGTREFASVSLVLDHETLDRVDVPTDGADVRGRFEVGEGFTSGTLDARYYAPLHRWITVDAGVWIGHQSGDDIPAHRTLLLGGTHESTVLGRTQSTFQGLASQEQSGRVAQVGRLGLRVHLTESAYVRGGVDVGAIRQDWDLPLERPMTGWALTAGTQTLIGPAELQLSKVWGERHDHRLSVNVGRRF